MKVERSKSRKSSPSLVSIDCAIFSACCGSLETFPISSASSLYCPVVSVVAGGRAELGKIVDALLCSKRLKKVVKTSMPLSSTRFLIFSACSSKLFSLSVLRRMLS